MAAVMLAGAPLCNEAFAAVNYSTATVADVKLENGVKFILDNGSTMQAVSVTTADKKVYMVDASVATVSTGAKDAVFEVVNYQKSALGATFGLKVNGKTFAHKAGGKYYTTFFTKVATGKEYSLANITSFDAYLEDGTQASNVFNSYSVSTTDLTYTVTDLNEFNQSSTSFSFGADAVEGNIFQELTPLATEASQKLKDGTTANGIIFVKGSADDIKKLNWTKKETAAKVSVAYVKNETWGLNTSAKGEGYKLVMINGAEFLADENPAVWDNAVFTKIVEADQLNAEGEINLTIKPIIAKETAGTEVNIAAVKASASDTKTYVTTVAASASTDTKYAKVIKPTLGDNTYFAASEFLSAGKSVYNVYFTSGKESVANKLTTEYHKYLTVISDGTYKADALAANDVQLNSPFAQWIATGFDGKYTLTLTNRQTKDNVVLKLKATTTAGVYKIVSTSGSTYTELPNLTDLPETTDNEQVLAGKEIKLVKTTVTKTDGYLDLTEEEMAAKVAFKFSGKSAELGKTSFVAAAQYDNSTKLSSIYPTQDENKIARFGIEKTGDKVLNEINYAYINENNQVVADAVDTLQVPVYNITYTYTKKGDTDPTVVYVKNRKFELDYAAAPTKEKFIFPKAMNGSYTMTLLAGTTTPSAFNAGRYATNIVKGSTIKFDETGSAFAPKAKEFTNLTVILNDNKDRTSLEAASRHATLDSRLGSVSMQENKKGILEGIIAAEPATFWLDTLTNGDEVSFYISKGIKAAAEETKADEAAAMRNFMYYANDSLNIFNEGSALATQNKNYLLEGTDSDVKAIFRPATLAAHDSLVTVVDGKEKSLVKDAVKAFQYGIVLADEEVADEYVIYSKANPAMFLYNLNGKLGFTTDEKKALVVTLGEGDATANEAIAAENIAVIAGEGVVTVKGAAGKQVVVSNILGQVIANKVATSDEETIAVAAGVAVVVVDGEATKVVVK